MDISVSTAVKLTLTNLDKLDTVTVYLEEMSPRQGRIVIHCWGQSLGGILACNGLSRDR